MASLVWNVGFPAVASGLRELPPAREGTEARGMGGGKNRSLVELITSNSSKALCVGACVCQEVAAYRAVGVNYSIGVDLISYRPSSSRETSTASPSPTPPSTSSSLMCSTTSSTRTASWEIERTLKPGRFYVLHVALSCRADKYSAYDLFAVKPLVALF
ncbi:hypothetical protein CRG98_026506 [Punica granatum]|uniref:Uncharacterized protein n=1 Tax=Punica granatum TaxID=22663 RepID=A0A2I0JA05_PUNGR|nr:hypothetical protein CRG98_026506 [Punica granatum]